jgi:ribose transport system substrate-binding protein
MGRIAVRKAVAAANGIDESEKSLIALPLYEDSKVGGDQAPHCEASQPPGAYLSNQLPDAQLNALSGAPADLP